MRQYFSGKTGGSSLPAETCAPELRSIPELWEIHRLLVKSRKAIGLNKGAIGTFRALVSLTRINHDPFVFASNRTLVERAEGASERTLRRHIADLIDVGLLTRNDSPNGKRYVVYGDDGEVLCYGFDLSPALALRPQLEEIARNAMEEENLKQFLKRKLGGLLYHAGLRSVSPDAMREHSLMRRRKLSADDLRRACDELAQLVEGDATSQSVKSQSTDQAIEATEMTAMDSQNDRHKITSNNQQLDSEEPAQIEVHPVAQSDGHLLRTVLAMSTEAMSYCDEPPRDWNEASALALKLSRFMGIHPEAYVKAVRKAGEPHAAMTIFSLLQISGRVRSLPAYFHSLTLGRKSAGFDPLSVLAREANT